MFSMSTLTGALKIITLRNSATFYFKLGKMIHAREQRRHLKLGELLLHKNLITKEQRDGALRTYRHEEGFDRIGRILITRGYISQENLTTAVREQMMDTVYEVLNWRNGHFVFFKDAKPNTEDIFLDVGLDQLLLEGLRRSDESKLERSNK